MRNVFYYNTLIGKLRIEEEDNVIVGVSVLDGNELEQGNDSEMGNESEQGNDSKQRKDSNRINERKHKKGSDRIKETDLIKTTYVQLMEYFDGKRTTFDVPIRLEGSSFQTKVWEELRKIPYGETRSYGEIAKMVGVPKGARAVGGANHNNPILIIVPCHRVIGSSGSLVGFGAGIPVKEMLLKLENKEIETKC